MDPAQCYWGLCFAPLASGGARLFGFPEFLAALALMVLAWTIADVRYRFRVRTAPIPLQGFTFSVIAAIGGSALMTDLWRAQQWLVPQGHLLSPAAWQAVLGGLFLLTFLTWAWYAFIRPPEFGKWNARRFSSQLYRSILKGSPMELPEIADELSRSARRLVMYSWESTELRWRQKENGDEMQRITRSLAARGHAYNILLMIADRKFCRHVVQTSPITALALFREAASQSKFDVPLDSFAKNITSEAIANKDSFAYHEVEAFDNGYVGFDKPLTKALYGNYLLADSLSHVFDVDYRERAGWDADQWTAFGRLLLVTFKSFVEGPKANQHPFIIFRAFHNVQSSVGGLYKLNGSTSEWWNDDIVKRLNFAVSFVNKAIEILDAESSQVQSTLRRRDEKQKDVYDLVADMIFAIFFEASAVKEPRDLCWAIQHNAVWAELMDTFNRSNGRARKIVMHKTRRLIYKEILRFGEWPNFKGSRVLGMALNVMGLQCAGASSAKEVRALQKVVLAWTKKNYARIAAESPRVAADCMVDGVAYEAEGPCLVKYGIQILDRPPSKTVLRLDPASSAPR